MPKCGSAHYGRHGTTSIICVRCGWCSAHPMDKQTGWCANCNAFTTVSAADRARALIRLVEEEQEEQAMRSQDTP